MISEYKYEPADTSFIVNVEDVDLRPIRLSLPRVPSDLSLIDGYGLAPKDQRFHRIEIPPKLLRLESNCRKFVDERARQKGSQFVVTRLRLQKEFWETLIKEKDYYAQEIEWIKKFWWYRLHGYWFFNHGKPVYITGWHFVYLHTWYVPEIQPDGYPHYRDRDRKEFLIHKYCYTCTESFKNFDKDGWAISDDIGRYQMIDIGKRLCYGLLQPKNRRSGNTNKGLCIIHEIDSRTIGTDGAGIMSYTGNNAEKHFKQKMLVAWDKMPIWLVPFTITPGTPQRIIYNVPGNEFSISGLKNGISYADTGSSTYYDGQKLIAALLDESGKCFGKGTLIKMFDGSVKKIEDIRVGDKLMGDDGGIRNVLVLGSGRGPMYKIIPNSGDEWRCNGDHILSLRKSYKELPVNGEKDDIFEITVNDFLKLKKYVQKGLMLYRVGVNYPARQHIIPSYALGLWLGDGSKNSFSITNEDKEIIKYLYELKTYLGCEIRIDDNIYYFYKDSKSNIIEYKNGLIINFYKKYSDIGITRSAVLWKNKRRSPDHFFEIIKRINIRTVLRDNNLLNNKHIPIEYLIDCQKNRLELLAGLIDTDGYAFKNKTGYEITQKNKILAYDIVELTRSLGFKVSINTKNATMKRKDGTLYECLVYRISIYGNDLWRIPCKVKRKKHKQDLLRRKNRNPMRSGFKVIYDNVDDFYGIVIDGNRRFLLSDYTVVHNTVTVDVDHRWQVVKNCLSQGMGSVIHGYSYHPSTVEEYSSGGDAYRRMANKSSFYQRIPGNHQTQSGLFRLFMPADEGLDGYIDSYGMSVRGEEPLPYQKEEGFKETATHFIKSTMEFLLKQDTPESLAEYRAIRKLFPLKWADCWVGESGEIGFPTEKINQRINELRKKSLTVTGNFEWSMGFHSNVVWKNDVNGRFEVSNLFTDIANRRIRDVVWDPINMEEKETWAPQFPDRGTIGADPYKFKSEAEIKKSYQKHGLSDGGIFVLWEYDRKIDGDKPRSEWESEDVICTYRYRPKTDDEFVEDVLKAAIWYGYMVYPESNINIIEKKFREWGYEGYLKYDIAPDGVMKVSPGMYLHTRNKQEGFNLMRNFLEFRVHKIKHLNFLIECNNINSIDQLTNYDLLAAGMCALSGSVSQYAKVLKRFNEKKIDVSLLVQRYRY